MAKVKLIGTIQSKKVNELVLRTIGYGRDGHEYPEDHDIHHAMKLPKLGKGQNLMIIGETQYDPETSEVWIEAEKMEATTEPSCNLAKAEGEAVGIFQFFERMEGKMSFGNGLIKTADGRWQRGVAFGFLAHHLSRNFRSGAIVRLAGRLRKQVYEKNGEERCLYEIVLDQNGTKVLKKAPDGDQYDFDKQDAGVGIVNKIKRAVTEAMDANKEASAEDLF